MPDLTELGLTENEIDFFRERAAILEYDANMTRYEAEHKAMKEVEDKRKLFKEVQR
jgi:hypothetical protein